MKVGSLVFASGCIPLDPATGQIVEGGIEAQAHQALKNLKAVVEASGSELGKVVKCTVSLFIPKSFLLETTGDDDASNECASEMLTRSRQVFMKNMDDFAAVNGIYARFFGEHKPARSAVEVARLPRDVLVEIEAIAR